MTKCHCSGPGGSPSSSKRQAKYAFPSKPVLCARTRLMNEDILSCYRKYVFPSLPQSLSLSPSAHSKTSGIGLVQRDKVLIFQQPHGPGQIEDRAVTTWGRKLQGTGCHLWQQPSGTRGSEHRGLCACACYGYERVYVCVLWTRIFTSSSW